MARPNDPRSLTALAKRIDGLSNNGLKKAITDGRCPPIPEGAFDVDDYVQRARREIKASTRPALSRAARMQQQQPARPPEPGDEEAESVEGDLSLAEASRRLEWAKAREKELKVEEQKGKLVDTALINNWVAGMIITARDELARIGPELRERLANELDPIVCEKMVTDRISQVLQKLRQFEPPSLMA
ncbi:MAG TPA: hypothetical protein VGM43_23185 [Bryobacteraceae bacterium]|jgi:hypothetical protein